LNDAAAKVLLQRVQKAPAATWQKTTVDNPLYVTDACNEKQLHVWVSRALGPVHKVTALAHVGFGKIPTGDKPDPTGANRAARRAALINLLLFISSGTLRRLCHVLCVACTVYSNHRYAPPMTAAPALKVEVAQQAAESSRKKVAKQAAKQAAAAAAGAPAAAVTPSKKAAAKAASAGAAAAASGGALEPPAAKKKKPSSATTAAAPADAGGPPVAPSVPTYKEFETVVVRFADANRLTPTQRECVCFISFYVFFYLFIIFPPLPSR
jgi:hypothetical protein